MKRKERMQKAVNEDTLIYVQEIIGSYRSMKERTVSFEKKHSSLLELSGVNMKAFLPESIPSEDLFVEPDIPPKDKEYGIPPCTSYGCVTSNTLETLQPRAFSSVLPVKECLPVQRPSC